MDITAITQIISNYGFPVIMVGYLLWYMNKREEEHKITLEKLSQSIENNTTAINTLLSAWGVHK